MNDLRVALIQTDILWENAEGNLKKFSDLISSITQPVDLIVLPEMFTTGFSMHSQKMAESMNGKSVNWMKQISENNNACVTGSIIIKENSKYYNRLLWVTPKGEVSYYDKRHLFRMSNEQDHFSPGNQKVIIELNGWKICPLICYDLRYPVWARNKENYDILLYVANWPKPRKKVWKILLKARALENMSYVIGVNRIGTDGNGYEFSGNSYAIDPKGEIITALPDNKEGIAIFNLSYENLHKFRQSFPAHLDADYFTIHHSE